MRYIKIQNVYRLLKEAEDNYVPCLLLAPTGYGKSAAVHYFYRRKATLELSGLHGKLDAMPDINSIRVSTIIIDNISFIRDEESKQYILSLFDHPEFHMIVIGRGRMPQWLMTKLFDRNYVLIGEKAFVLNTSHVKAFLENYHLHLSEADIKLLTKASRGFPVSVMAMCGHLLKGEKIQEFTQGLGWEDVFSYFKEHVYRYLPPDVKMFYLKMGVFKKFDSDMAKVITGFDYVHSIIEYSLDVGHFVTLDEHGIWVMRDEFVKFFDWRRGLEMTPEDVRAICIAGARYYEDKQEDVLAVKYYQKAHQRNDMIRILKNNAKRRPSLAHYKELEPYYMNLTDQEVRSSFYLNKGICLVHYFLLRNNESHYWYQELIGNKNEIDEYEYQIQMDMLQLYLHFSSPRTLIENFTQLCCESQRYHLSIPPIDLTLAMPSLMNGGVDFSTYLTVDDKIWHNLSSSLIDLYGDEGKGLILLLQSEKRMICDEKPHYEILRDLCEASELVNHGRQLDLRFVAAACITRMHIFDGQYESAEKWLRTFQDSLVDKKEERLKMNVEAFATALKLYVGDEQAARHYLSIAPNIQEGLYMLDNYRYLITIKAYVTINELQLALDNIHFLQSYYKRKNNIINMIILQIIESIILYRLGNDHFKEVFQEAFRKAQKYHYVYFIAQEGRAILPILEASYDQSFDQAFYKHVLQETRKIAAYYPENLSYIPEREIHLTNRETEILGMLTAGLSSDEICQRCRISYSGLKKHNRNIYRKLGVKSRSEAERMAKRLHLLAKDAHPWD